MRHQRLRFFLPILGLLAGFVTARAPLAAPAPKVEVCHKRGNGSYGPLSISANALPAHLAHGDVQQPNGLIPGSPDFVFDSECAVQSWDYAVNVPPDPSAEDPSSPGTLFVGTGIPAENFGTARNEDIGIELGLMVLYRQGPTVPSTDDYADGVLHVAVNSGPQSTSNGSSANNATRAAWNFTFSVATGLNGATTDLKTYDISDRQSMGQLREADRWHEQGERCHSEFGSKESRNQLDMSMCKFLHPGTRMCNLIVIVPAMVVGKRDERIARNRL